MIPDKPQRYAFYARVSTALQAERGTIEQQHNAFMDHRKRNGDYTPVKVYEDDGVSGGLPFHKRRAGREMLADAEARMFDVLVVYSISRFARNTLEALSILRRLKEDYGVAFVSLQENYDTSTPAGYFAFTNMAGVFQLEKDTILERTRNGKKALLREGLLPDGKARFGWRRANPDRSKRRVEESRLVEDEREAPVVREIFRLFVYEGMGSVLISDLLTARDVPTPMEGKRLKQHFSGKWQPCVVRQILRREAYATGRIPYNQTKRVKRDGEVIGRAPNPEDEWAWIDAPPLIDRETFDLAQERLKESFRRINKNGVRQYPLRGRFVCLRCHGLGFVGRTHRYSVASGEVREKPYYSCLSRWRRAATNKCNTNLNAEPIEAEVWEQVKELLLNAGSYVDEAVAEWHRRNSVEKPERKPEDDLEHVTARLDQLDRECQILRDMVRTGFSTQEECAKDMAKVRAEQTRLKSIQVRLLETPQSPGKNEVAHAATMARHFLNRLHAAVAAAEENETLREELIRSLLIRIEVNGAHAEAVYNAEQPVPGTSNQSDYMSRYALGLHVRRPLLVAA